MRTPQKKPVLAITYVVVVLLAAAWALYVDATLLHSHREHLLPDTVLAVVTLPLSCSLDLLFKNWPDIFSLPFAQIGYLILCGLAQAWLPFILTQRLLRSTNSR